MNPSQSISQDEDKADSQKKTSSKGGGPQTPHGKKISSQNALKTGLHCSYWLDQQEEDEYDSLVRDLCIEYGAVSKTLIIQIERLAVAMVKLRRTQKIESAMYLRARQIAVEQFDQRSDESLPAKADRAQFESLMQWIAVPDTDRLNMLQRQQTSLDRQVSKIIGEIQVLATQTRVISHQKFNHPNGNSSEVIGYSNKTEHKISEII